MVRLVDQLKTHVFLQKVILRLLLLVLVIGSFTVLSITGCAAPRSDPFAARLATMSDGELISYYRGTNDRMKEIQAGTREADHQGTVFQEDQLGKMPYVAGGEAWQLERKLAKVNKELHRRGIVP